jgi:hypothetical protein
MDPVEKPLETLRHALATLRNKKKKLPVAAQQELWETINVCLLNSALPRRSDELTPLVTEALAVAVATVRASGFGRERLQETAFESVRLLSRFDPPRTVRVLSEAWKTGQLPPDSWITRAIGDAIVFNGSREAAIPTLNTCASCLGKVHGERMRGMMAVLLAQVAEVLQAEDLQSVSALACAQVLEKWLCETTLPSMERLASALVRALGLLATTDVLVLLLAKLKQMRTAKLIANALGGVNRLLGETRICGPSVDVPDVMALLSSYSRDELLAGESRKSLAVLLQHHTDATLASLGTGKQLPVPLESLRYALDALKIALSNVQKGFLVLAVRPFVRGEKFESEDAVARVLVSLANVGCLLLAGGEEIVAGRFARLAMSPRAILRRVCASGVSGTARACAGAVHYRCCRVLRSNVQFANGESAG